MCQVKKKVSMYLTFITHSFFLFSFFIFHFYTLLLYRKTLSILYIYSRMNLGHNFKIGSISEKGAALSNVRMKSTDIIYIFCWLENIVTFYLGKNIHVTNTTKTQHFSVFLFAMREISLYSVVSR